MKKKISFLKLKWLLPLFAIAFAVSVPLRLYEYFSVLEPKTGFFTSINWAVYALYAVLIVYALICCFISFFASETVESKMPEGKNRLLGVVSFVFAAAFVVEAVLSISDFAEKLFGYYNGNQDISLWKYITASGYLPILIGIIFSLFSIIYFIVFGMSYFAGRNTFQDSKLLALSPMLWAVCRMITDLMRPINYAKVSELLIEMFAFVFLMLTFLSFARVSSQLSEKGEMRKLFAFGFTASLLCLVCSVPRGVLVLIGQSAKLADDYKFDITLFASSVFLTVFVAVEMYMGNKELPKEEEEQLEEEIIDDNFLSE